NEYQIGQSSFFGEIRFNPRLVEQNIEQIKKITTEAKNLNIDLDSPETKKARVFVEKLDELKKYKRWTGDRQFINALGRIKDIAEVEGYSDEELLTKNKEITKLENQIREAKTEIDKQNLSKNMPKHFEIIKLKAELLEFKNKLNNEKSIIDSVFEQKKELEAARNNPKYDQSKIKSEIIKVDNYLKEANKIHNENKNRLSQFEKLKEAKIFEEKIKATAKPPLDIIEEISTEAALLGKYIYIKMGQVSDKLYETIDTIQSQLGIQERHRMLRPIEKEKWANLLKETDYLYKALGESEDRTTIAKSIDAFVNSAFSLPIESLNLTAQTLASGNEIKKSEIREKEKLFQNFYADKMPEGTGFLSRGIIGASGILGYWTLRFINAPASTINTLWGMQGANMILEDLDDKGVNRTLSIPVAATGGYLYQKMENFINLSMAKGLNRKFTDGYLKSLYKSIPKYAADFAINVAEEGAQEGIITTSKLAAINIENLLNRDTLNKIPTENLNIIQSTYNEMLNTWESMAILNLATLGISN
ncbi:MAG TPA: hypothetical protein PLJ38_08930, partial [bacterium]|nr:hypothetical protein [bacterium]